MLENLGCLFLHLHNCENFFNLCHNFSYILFLFCFNAYNECYANFVSLQTTSNLILIINTHIEEW